MLKTIKKLISSLVLISTVTTCFTVPAKADEIPLVGWTTINNGKQQYDTLIDTSVKHSGNASIKLSYKTVGGNDVYAMFRQNVPVKKNTTYRYGFWAKAEKIKNIFSCISWGTRYYLTTFGENYDWKYFEFEWYSGEETQAEFQIILDGNTKNVWFDDLFMVEKGKTTNILANPGLEDGVTSAVLQEQAKEEAEAAGVDVSVEETSETKKISESGLDFLNARFLPTYKNEEIVIDGDLSDWKDAVPVTLQGDGYTPTMRTMYDEEYFYLSAELDDEVQTAVTTGTGLDGKDCLVVVIGKESEVYGTDMKAVFVENGPLIMYSEQWHESDYKKMITYGKNENGKSVYELAYPWSLLGTDSINNDLMINIAVVDHDDSMTGRRNVEFATGMGTTRQNDDFIRIHCMDGGVTGSVSAPYSTYTDEETGCTVMAINPTNETLDMAVDFNGKSENVKVAGGEVYRKTVPMTFTESGLNPVPATLTYGDKEVKLNKDVDVSRSEKRIYDDADKIKNVLLPELKALIDQCKAKGITVGYEESWYHNIDFNLELIPEAMKMKKATHAEFVLDDLMKIYNETKESLNGYLAGTKTARDTYRYENSKVEIDGQSVWGDTVKYSTGEVERRPVYLNGFNSFESGEPADVFKDLGYNFLSVELGIDRGIIDATGIFGWEVIGGKPAEVNVVYEDDSKRNSALRISSQEETTPNSYKQIWQKYTGKANTEYEFSFRAKGTNAHNIWLAGNGWNSDRLALPEGTFDWTEFSGEFVTGENPNLEFFVICDGKVDELLVDDIVVYEKGTKKNILYNADFEMGRELEEYEGMRFMASNFNHFLDIFKNAAEKDVSICLQIATHYWPWFTIDSDDGWCEGSFTGNVNYGYERVRVVTEYFLKNLLPLIKDEENLHSIILGNEPGFCTLNNVNFFEPLWKEWLIRKYDNDISKLNKNYNEDYLSFDEVTFAEVKGDSTVNWMHLGQPINGRDKAPIFYDWMMFNYETYTDWVAFMYNTVKKYAPDVKIHIKQMSGRWRFEHAYFRTWLRNGVNAEMMSEVTDYHGCDSQGILNNEEQSMQTKMRWYDYITSIKNMPVMNSEDHIIPDNTNNLDPKYAQWAGATIWQGAIHGCTGVTTWVWCRNYEWNEGNGSVTQRPYAMKLQTDATFDLNRLAYEVKALTDSKAEVAIVDSYSAHALDAVYENVAFNAWQSSCYSGQRTDFITEKLCEEGKLNQYKVVILPKCDRIPKSVIDALNNYNGRIILLGEDNLKYDEYGNPHDPALYKGIYDRARIVPITWENLAMTSPSNPEIRDILLGEYAALGMNKVMLIDTATNKPVYDVEWEYAEYNGNIIINANNYNWNALPTVAVEINGQRVSEFTELRSAETKNGTITIKPYEPVMIMCK